ncbi:MAG: 2-oxoglutarate dehydrogenase complex dihydrolipoyllysine-residue succinyltransferase [Opitutaceae bacterium]|nr:2-oxoglutarate dehydrogenase complex dihydrolipoyllysine-residue succinyltransferase [Cytophagales bacterium]
MEVKVPTVGESISEVTIAKWHKKSGDSVKVNDLLCELESDKATFELNAESDGVLEVLAKEGDTVPIGALLCKIEGNGVVSKPATTPAAVDQVKPAPQSQPSATGKILEVKVPTVGESITEVTLSNWLKKDGDTVKLNDVLCELESDKATFELNAEANGILKTIAKQGDTLPIGAVICKIEVMEGGSQSVPQSNPTASISAQASSNGNYAAGHASPAASKILAEKGVNSSDVKGTGIDGRITKEDANNAQKAEEPAPKAANSSPVQTGPIFSGGSRDQSRQKMTPLRKTVARRLVAVKNETAMLTTFNEVNMKPIMDLRTKYKDMFKEKHGVGLGFMSFFTKACCMALKEFPAVNAQIDGEELVYNSFCDVSIAVSAPKGLVVPVIRNAEQMSFDQIEKEVVRLATKARDNKLTIEEMTGGTFTITNGGIFGSMLSTPIINAPQSAILGMHNIVERPMAVGGQVVIQPIMYVALSYDHRIIDGRESVGFLVRVKQLLEDPTRLILGV